MGKITIEDRRPNKPITLENIIHIVYQSKEFMRNGSLDKFNLSTEINKYLLSKQCKENIYISQKKVRYSRNYITERQSDGRKWQGWHSIDFVLNDGKIPDSLSNYAFVIQYEMNLEVLIITKTKLKELLIEKEKQNSYTDYENAQLKKCRKFNFYFTEKLDNQLSTLSNKEKDSNNIRVTVMPNYSFHKGSRFIFKIQSLKIYKCLCEMLKGIMK